jgi:hypothetical protein
MFDISCNQHFVRSHNYSFNVMVIILLADLLLLNFYANYDGLARTKDIFIYWVGQLDNTSFTWKGEQSQFYECRVYQMYHNSGSGSM